MNTTALVKAITESIIFSFGHGFVIVLFLKLMFKAFPEIPSGLKFRFWYSALVVVFVLFIFSIISVYTSRLHGLESFGEGNRLISSDTSSSSIFDRIRLWEAQYSIVVVAAYFIGVCYQFVSLSLSWLGLRRLLKSGILLADQKLNANFDSLRLRVGIVQEVIFYISHQIAVPFTTGFIKPLVFLPAAMVNNLTMQQVEAIVLHELAHIRRHDYLLHIIQKVVECVLFFNPFAWLINREIHKEREFCCDETVVSFTNDPLTYSRALLLLEEQKDQNMLAMAATGSSKYPLLTRIKRLTVMKKINSSPRLRSIGLLAVLGIGISLAFALPESEKAKTDTNRTTKIEKKVVSNKRISIQKSVISDSAPQKNSSKIITKVDDEFYVVTDTGKRKITNPEWKKLHHELLENTEQIRKHAEEQAKFFASDEWENHQKEILAHSEELRKQFDNPEWKKLQKDIQLNAAKIRSHFGSPEWKKLQEDIQANAKRLAANQSSEELNMKQEELSKKMEELSSKFESSNWKKTQEQLEKQAELFEKRFESEDWKKREAEIERKSQELQKKLESPEWKAKMKELENKTQLIEQKLQDIEE